MKTRSAHRMLMECELSSSAGFGNGSNNLNDKAKAESKKRNIGHWNPQEQALYFIFLKNHKENFIKKEMRRTDKIFKEMSKFIKTRCPDQCRSHHQKMQNKFPQFDDILENLRVNCPENVVQDLLKSFEEQNKCYLFSAAQTVQGQMLDQCLQQMEQKASESNEEICLLTFDEIIKMQQAIKPTMLLADELFSIGNTIQL